MTPRTATRSLSMPMIPLIALAGTLAGAVTWSSAVLAQEREVPQGIPVDGFTQLLPRGVIAAVVDPVFVKAQDAEMPDEAWVLGYAAGGEAYAYDLNLLNSHEIVNHKAAGAPIAAVW